MLKYKTIEILTSEDARYRGKPIADAVIDYLRDLKIAARCIVTRGIAGCSENGEVCNGRVEVLSFNLPIRISIVLPAAEVEQVLAGLDPLVSDGIIALHDLTVVSHKAAKAFFPRQLLVKDVMSANPTSITAEQPLSEAARLLLSSIFTGLPVVDGLGHPVGVVTQGDLIAKGGLPLRLGLLAESEQAEQEAMLAALTQHQVQEIMTTPALSIQDDQLLTEAVDRMLGKHLKRLPVVDKGGRLVGMLSRLDIFTTVMREAPDWQSFRAQQIEVSNLRTVKDILRRDTRTVSPDTTLDQVIQIIDGNDMQCVAVVNDNGTLIGMITDSDLLHALKPDAEGLRSLFARLIHGTCANLPQRLATTTAFAVMRAELVTVQEDSLIEAAIGLMTEKRLKRLPVIDSSGRFQGMINRDSLLRTGYGRVFA